MPLRVAGQFAITSGGTGTVAGGVSNVIGTFLDLSLQGKTDADVAVNDYLSVTLPDQSAWRWRIAAINSTGPLNINVVFDDDSVGFPVAFSANPIIPSTAAIAGAMSPTAQQSFIPSFSTYRIAEQLQAGLIANEGGGVVAQAGWTVTNPIVDRTLDDGQGTTVQDLSRVLGSLITDLKTAGVLTS